MRCPFCSADETRVVDSRLADQGDSVRRRRRCTACTGRFTTFEHAQLRLPQVVKSDARREQFDEVKLRGGISRALQKRPVTRERIETAIQRILRKVTASGDREVPAAVVGLYVMQELREMDEVGYVRFASVYRRFQDVEDFDTELKRMREDDSRAGDRRQMSLLESEEAQASPTLAKSKAKRATTGAQTKDA